MIETSGVFTPVPTLHVESVVPAPRVSVFTVEVCFRARAYSLGRCYPAALSMIASDCLTRWPCSSNQHNPEDFQTRVSALPESLTLTAHLCLWS